jgi:hypothetical protein
MADDRKNDPPDERPLPGRKFELADAIGRENAGALKGASPVARSRQLLAEIEHALERHLHDPEGSLRRTLLARLEDDAPLLGRHHDRPLGALAEFVDRTLGSEAELEALVRDTDARWGRDYQERPYFESRDRPPHPDDPYRIDQVRQWLRTLRTRLAAAD